MEPDGRCYRQPDATKGNLNGNRAEVSPCHCGIVSICREESLEKDLSDELQAHLNLAIRDRIARGESPAQARNNARRELGNQLLIRETTRGMWGVRAAKWFRANGLWQDVQYAVRQFRFSPGFATVAILTLALGIGANTAIFQLLNAVRLQSLPVKNPQELVEIKIPEEYLGFGSNHGWSSLTYPLWEQIRDHQQSFSGVFAWGADGAAVGEGDAQRQARGVWASGDAFPTLGVVAERGRLFMPEDDRNGCASECSRHQPWLLAA